MAEMTIRKLPLKNILQDAWQYGVTNLKVNLLFAAVAYIVGALALFSWKSWFFLPVLILIYVLWGVSFRYYLKRRPYFGWTALFNSLIPSTKIVVLSVLVVSVLVMLPIVPLFLNISPEFNLVYAQFLQGNFEQTQILIWATDVVFLLISPIIAYRPFLAWISALAGRSGSLRYAWSRTRGNYIGFLLIAIMTNLSIIAVRGVIWYLGGNDYMTLLFAAPLTIYFNIVSVKAYEFFFLDIE